MTLQEEFGKQITTDFFTNAVQYFNSTVNKIADTIYTHLRETVQSSIDNKEENSEASEKEVSSILEYYLHSNISSTYFALYSNSGKTLAEMHFDEQIFPKKLLIDAVEAELLSKGIKTCYNRENDYHYFYAIFRPKYE